MTCLMLCICHSVLRHRSSVVHFKLAIISFIAKYSVSILGSIQSIFIKHSSTDWTPVFTQIFDQIAWVHKNSRHGTIFLKTIENLTEGIYTLALDSFLQPVQPRPSNYEYLLWPRHNQFTVPLTNETSALAFLHSTQFLKCISNHCPTKLSYRLRSYWKVRKIYIHFSCQTSESLLYYFHIFTSKIPIDHQIRLSLGALSMEMWKDSNCFLQRMQQFIISRLFSLADRVLKSTSRLFLSDGAFMKIQRRFAFF